MGLTKFSVLLTGVVILGNACSQEHFYKSSTSEDLAASRLEVSSVKTLNDQFLEDLEFQFQAQTTANLIKALRKASLVLMGRIPNEGEISSIDTKGPQAYEQIVKGYLESTEFKARLRSFHSEIFEMGGALNGVNFNEPTNLADYLVNNEMDQREILTAKYCVNDIQQKVPCSAFLTPALQEAQSAGALTTQAFLVKFEGPFFFRRVRKAQEIFTCRSFPLMNEVGLGEDEISDSLKKFNSKTETPQCYSCHRSMNARALMFFSFDRKGVFSPTPNMDPRRGEIVVTDTGAAADRSMILTTKAVPRIYEKEVSSLQQMAQIMSQTKDFRDCIAQRYGNFILGQEISKSLPVDISYLKNLVDHRQFKVKLVILDVLKSDKFIRGE